MVKVRTEWIDKAGVVHQLKKPKIKIGKNLGEEEQVTVTLTSKIFENEGGTGTKKWTNYSVYGMYDGQEVSVEITDISASRLKEYDYIGKEFVFCRKFLAGGKEMIDVVPTDSTLVKKDQTTLTPQPQGVNNTPGMVNTDVVPTQIKEISDGPLDPEMLEYIKSYIGSVPKDDQNVYHFIVTYQLKTLPALGVQFKKLKKIFEDNINMEDVK